MINGMFCSAWHWSNYEDFFMTKGYECIVPTLRYHNTDPKEPPNPKLGTTSLLDYAEDLENLILHLDEKPILMGHSMGGLFAQIWGSRGLAKALVLLTPAPPSGINALKVDESKVTCPVLVISGAQDKITPASVTRKVADKYKTVSTHQELENHAHWALSEPGWEKVAASIPVWLQSISKKE
jgi:pimeloyl-ACP methyl ester carboxylesterase